MENLKISIVVPVYNVEKYLSQCLDSLINQTYTYLEIICVNDGSTDNCLDILYKYANKDNRIKIINQENRGLSVARNNAIPHITGDYIMFVDSDDWIDHETCSTALKEAVNHNAEVVIWSYIREYENKSLKKTIFDKKIIFDSTDTKNKIHRRIVGPINDELSKPDNLDSVVTVWGKLYKSHLITETDIKFVDCILIGTEDALFNIYVFGKVKSTVFIPKNFYHYRKTNQDSLTSKYNKKLSEGWSNLYELIEEYIKKEKLGKVYCTALNNRIALNIIGLGLNIIGSNMSIQNKMMEIRKMINNKKYKKANEQLTYKDFPLHWKLFFFCYRIGFAEGLYILLLIMKTLKSRI